VPIPPESWRQSGDHWLAEGETELPGRQVVTLIASLAGYAAHRHTLIDPSASGGNPRLSTFRVFDQDLESIRESLAAEGSQGAAQFDPAVCLLFALAGFQVIPLSRDNRLREAPDFIAHVPGSLVCLVVECTTGPLNSNEKLGKILARAEAVRRACPEMGVQAIIVTSLEREQVLEADLHAAAQDDLAVMCGEDLDELLTLVLGGAPINDVVSLLYSRVPEKT
jgi:hypothetical protein